MEWRSIRPGSLPGDLPGCHPLSGRTRSVIGQFGAGWPGTRPADDTDPRLLEINCRWSCIPSGAIHLALVGNGFYGYSTTARFAAKYSPRDRDLPGGGRGRFYRNGPSLE